MTLYSAPTGTVKIAGGLEIVPSWVSSIPSNTIAPIEATTWFSRASALLGPEIQWPGTASIRAIVDAYGDPIKVGKKVYFSGGGHGDGFCNAIPVYDLETRTMSIDIAATPGSCYPPGFPNATWPSGQGVDWLRTFSQHAPADQSFAAPFSAPRMTHRYGGQAARTKEGVPQEIMWFYATPNKYNLTTKSWGNQHELGGDYVIQRVATRANIVQAGLGTNIGPTVTLQQGTMALYDEVTDRYYVTLIPGDAGGGWRNFFFCWDPNTDTVPSIHRPAVPCRESMTWVQAGRHIYGITSPYSVPYPNMQQRVGFRFNIDTQAIEYFNVTGQYPIYQQSAGSGAGGQEGVPYLHDTTRNTLVGWSHNVTDRGSLYELPLNTFGTQGGSGTFADPYLWSQSKITLSGTPPSIVAYKYNGFWYEPDYGLYIVFPRADSPPYAIRR
jgi:hypothetical protein